MPVLDDGFTNLCIGTITRGRPPTLADFQILGSSVNGDANALKEIGQGSGVGAGTNTSGFSALLAGAHHYDGYFLQLGNYTFFWTSTHSEDPFAWDIWLDQYVIHFDYYGFTQFGLSVRCIKD
jgi:uncharacterized protein (TIGR02145 family)